MLPEFHIFFACLRKKHIGKTSKVSSNVEGLLRKGSGKEERKMMEHMWSVTQRPACKW